MVQGARREVLRTEQCLMGGGLHGYLFGVLGREACAALGAVNRAVSGELRTYILKSISSRSG
eukprot:scaffold31926_cov45-Phaeocystis_antarctica.AAC.2